MYWDELGNLETIDIVLKNDIKEIFKNLEFVNDDCIDLSIQLALEDYKTFSSQDDFNYSLVKFGVLIYLKIAFLRINQEYDLVKELYQVRQDWWRILKLPQNYE